MKTIHFAIASIFYHKKPWSFIRLYFFAVIGLIVTFALIYSMDQVIAQTRDLLTTEDLQTKVAEEKPVTTIYHQLFYLIFSAFTGLYRLSSLLPIIETLRIHCLVSKRATTRQWVAMQLLEMYSCRF